MKPFAVKPLKAVRGTIELPGDKSIAHRSILISSLSHGTTHITNFPVNKDCLATIQVLKQLGIRIVRQDTRVTVYGKGPSGFKKPKGPIYIEASGTTLRLMSGILAGMPFETKLVAGKGLSRRPMLRVTLPLRVMGADIDARRLPSGEEYPPVLIHGTTLKPVTYTVPVASAQVKSCILLAGLFTQGTTSVIEAVPTRDHTERMLRLFRRPIKISGHKISVQGNKALVSPGKIYVPETFPQQVSLSSWHLLLRTRTSVSAR